MIDILEPYYEGNQRKLEKLKIFKEKYDPKDAAKWYTDDSFLFYIMNNALRNRDVELIFLMEFFLDDLYRQLAEECQKQRSGHFKKPVLFRTYQK